MREDRLITSKELEGFIKRLSSVNVDSLLMTSYAKRYLQHLILHKRFYCRIYAQLLNLVLKNCAKKKEDICLVDYGAGNGIIGLLAVYCGFGKVYINDLSADFIQAAKELSKAMGIQPDGFIEGDVENVQEYLSNIVPDVVVSSDVIEHIYDLDIFFETVKQINPGVVTVMRTACNPANYFIVRQLKKMQLKDELLGGSPDDHVLFGEAAIEPFVVIRRKIIKASSLGKLNDVEINTLATLTRGLRKVDIERAVEKYIVDKTLPVTLSHPTNTCDPMTGSWSERLLNFEEYKMIYAKAGFDVEFYKGFYNEYENTVKSKLLFFVNRMIPFAGYKLAPFINIIGKV